MKNKIYRGGLLQNAVQNIDKKNVIKGATLFFSVIILGVGLGYMSKDANSLTSDTYLYTFATIIPLIGVFIFALGKGSFLSDEYSKYMLMGVIGCAIFMGLFYYLSTYLTSTSLVLINFVSNILIFLMIMLGLAIFFKMFANNLMKSGGKSKFIILLIFYIPCLLSDAIQFVKDQLHVTPNIVYILLIFELVLILSYFVLTRYFSFHLLNGGIELHSGKIFLDTQKIITLADSTNVNFNTTSTDLSTLDINANDLSRKEYSLSIWLHLNAPEMSDIVFPIICYGNNDTTGKPIITYGYDDEFKNFVLTIGMSNTLSSSGSSSTIKIAVPHQKWNNLVFNYKGFNSDLFVNGILERSVNLTENIPTFSVSDTITVGSNKSGMNGAIANILYYKQPLSALEILGSYRLGINTINL
jgi:hypothetical protein